MRPGNNNNRRGRNRGPRKPHGGMPNKNQNFDGGGSDTRVRGNVYQVLEKYLQLARDAGVAGDRVAAENFLQHADHYYRVITTMNDGQRPRVGGREISVADVNVQNVSQGLSAALYSGGPSQPNLADGANAGPAPQQGGGNPRNNDGFNAGQNNNHGGNNQAGEPQSRDNHARDNSGGGNNGGASENGGDYAQPAPHRSNRGRGSNAGGRYAGPSGGQPPVQVDNSAALGTVEREPAVNSAPSPTQTSDEQPDYPDHLLAAAAPEAAAEGPRPPRDANAGPRAPRGRLRVRRPRPAGAEGEGELATDTKAPVTEDNE